MSDSFAPSESPGAQPSYVARPQDLRIDGALGTASSNAKEGRSNILVGARVVVAVLCASALVVGHFAPALAHALILF